MTIIISAFGIAGRFAGDLLTSALGWASNMLFGRVPRTHQRYVVGMMGLSFLWLIALLGLIPTVSQFYLAATPHPGSVDGQLLGTVLLAAVLLLPLAVGLCGYLVPADGARGAPMQLARELLRGYILAPVLVGLLLFLAIVGVVRKIRSRRHGWSDVHVPIVTETSGYDKLVQDLIDGLAAAGIDVEQRDGPRVLEAAAWILIHVSGERVRQMRPDRLVELVGRNLRIGVYPSDVAISGPDGTRIRARAAILAKLVASEAHLTTSAEAQKAEDELRKLTDSRRWDGGRSVRTIDAAFSGIDERLLGLAIPTDEWDILYRLRLQAERDLLIGAEPGTAFPGSEVAAR